MKKSICILDICIFGLSITALLIAFFKNLSNVNLKVLAEGNLITSKKVGLEIYYSLNIEKYNVLSRWFQFLNDIENFKEKGIK